MKPRPLLRGARTGRPDRSCPRLRWRFLGFRVAELAPPGAPVFVEGALRRRGELKSNTEAIAERVAGIDNLGEYVVEKLESSAAPRRRTGRLHQGSRALAGRARRRLLREARRGERLQRGRSDRRIDRYGRNPGIHRHPGEGQRRSIRGRLLRRGRFRGRGRGRERDRRRRRLSRSRRRRRGLQGSRWTLRRRLARRRRHLLQGDLRRLGRQPRRRLRRRRQADRPVRRADRPDGSPDPRQRRHRSQRSDGGGQHRAGLRPGRHRIQQRPGRPGSADRRCLLAARGTAGQRLRRLRGLRLRQAAGGSGRQPRQGGDPGCGPAGTAEEGSRSSSASTWKASPARCRTPVPSRSATTRAASAARWC